MLSIGLDIGTTKICGIVAGVEDGKILKTVNKDNNTFLPPDHAWEKTQNPIQILEKIYEILDEIRYSFKNICAIGITGQMHGILYVDSAGNPLSPLYTWQDCRSNLIYKEDITYTEYIKEKTNYMVPAGFGCATHFYNSINRLIPAKAVKFCSIADFVAMKICNKTCLNTHISFASSYGFYELTEKTFDFKAIRTLNLQPELFPPVEDNNALIGYYKHIPVYIPIGDNQASFLGSTDSIFDNLLMNIGTGSQISYATADPDDNLQIETRPLFDNIYLKVGSALCGGRAFAILKDFYLSILQDFTEIKTSALHDHIYSTMLKHARKIECADNRLHVHTQFYGTRRDPSATGAILNVNGDNFNHSYLTFGVLQGITEELFHIFKSGESKQFTHIIGSGNGIRKNYLLKSIIEETFQLKLKTPLYTEEAAFGASIFAMFKNNNFKTIQEAIKLNKYEE